MRPLSPTSFLLSFWVTSKSSPWPNSFSTNFVLYGGTQIEVPLFMMSSCTSSEIEPPSRGPGTFDSLFVSARYLFPSTPNLSSFLGTANLLPDRWSQGWLLSCVSNSELKSFFFPLYFNHHRCFFFPFIDLPSTVLEVTDTFLLSLVRIVCPQLSTLFLGALTDHWWYCSPC